MNKVVLDDFADLSGWIPVASGLAQLSISQDQGLHGKAMRLDFDFKGGGGFVVARKVFSFSLPDAYAFNFNIRGSAPPNKFEFKLADPLNQNVWWYHQDAFSFPQEWTTLQIKSSQIEFAWGPAGSGPMRQVGAVEFVIAAGPGGSGTVWIEDLGFTDHSFRATPRVLASSTLNGHEPAAAFDQSATTSWRSEPSTGPQWFLIDFQEEREYGGLIIQWESGAGARAFDIQASTDANSWKTLYSANHADGVRSYVYLPNGSSRYLKLNLLEEVAGRGFGIVDIAIQPFDFSRSIQAFFQNVAKQEPKGYYPKYLYGEQTYWTPVGVAEGVTQGLLNEEGMVEVDKGSFSIEPFVSVDGNLVTWADAKTTQQLEQGYLPIPSSVWRTDALVLTTTVYAASVSNQPVLYIRYRIVNSANRFRDIRFFAAIRPFQVTPPWQSFNNLGGVSPIRELAYHAGGLWINHSKVVIPLTAPSQFGAAAFAQGAVTEYLKTGVVPSQTQVNDEFGYASGALRYDLRLAPNALQDIYLAIPFGTLDDGQEIPAGLVSPEFSGARQFEIAVGAWTRTLGAVDVRLPQAAQGFVDTFKTAAAHILINRNGPALHPGPRRYTRAWIRDGATMAAALLRVGCIHEVGDFIRWYAHYQAVDGNVPCAVDHKGADWLPEHDSHGEFIYTVMEYFRFSSDRALTIDLWPAVVKAVDYIEALRSQRLTAEYQQPERRACYGLLPESVSHEGYLAHPVHAYWDDFWALRGLKDAAALAAILGDQTQAQRIAALRDSFCETLYASIGTTMSERHIEYIPGSVEWADCDPAATAVAITLADELHNMTPAAVERTFNEFLARFRAMHSHSVEWTNYTPYEIRIIGALVRLGKRDSVHELAEFFLSDRRPLPWNQWPEIAWRDPTTPGHMGDLPHTWIGAEYLLAFCNLFAYEREADQALVIAAGVPPAWLDDGVEVRDLPTYYGKLSYSLRREGSDTLLLSLSGDLAVPPGKFIAIPPLPQPIVAVAVNGEQIRTFDTDSIAIERCPADVVIQCTRS